MGLPSSHRRLRRLCHCRLCLFRRRFSWVQSPIVTAATTRRRTHIHAGRQVALAWSAPRAACPHFVHTHAAVRYLWRHATHTTGSHHASYASLGRLFVMKLVTSMGASADVTPPFPHFIAGPTSVLIHTIHVHISPVFFAHKHRIPSCPPHNFPLFHSSLMFSPSLPSKSISATSPRSAGHVQPFACIAPATAF